MDKLIIYFFRVMENYFGVEIKNDKVANTKRLVKILQDKTGTALLKDEKSVPYPENYQVCTAQIQADALPALTILGQK